MKKNNWLTRSILGIGLTSLFSDMGHEMTTELADSHQCLKVKKSVDNG